MIGILLVTHESLGASLARCAEHILGAMPAQLECIGVLPKDDPAQVRLRARDALQRLDQGDGVMVFTDVAGATPCNVAATLIAPGRIEAIAGVNLPMLMRALTYRQGSLGDLSEKARIGGVAGIVSVPAC